MTSKIVLYVLIVLSITINYLIVCEYFEKYAISFSNIEKTYNLERSKCIEYFDSKNRNNKTDIECLPYSHDYVVFILQRAYDIKNYFIINMILTMIISVIFILDY